MVLCQKLYFLVKRFDKEKKQNIHLNNTFSLKTAKISLQKQHFPGIRFPNSTVLSRERLHKNVAEIIIIKNNSKTVLQRQLKCSLLYFINALPSPKY